MKKLANGVRILLLHSAHCLILGFLMIIRILYHREHKVDTTIKRNKGVAAILGSVFVKFGKTRGFIKCPEVVPTVGFYEGT